jgi:hypothetical protein
MSKALFKTTIVIWSEYNPEGVVELADLAREATDGEAYCSKMVSVGVADPPADPDWDGTEFFQRGWESLYDDNGNLKTGV